MSRRIAQVTQLTSKTTAVDTKRAYEGIITTVPLTDSADGDFSFQVNNDVVQAVSNIQLTTEYSSLNGNSSRTVTLTGTSGTANINIDGTNYLATFTSNLTTSATNFVTSHGATLSALGITVTSSGAVLTIVADTDTFPAITRANVSGDLSATLGTVTEVASTGNPIANLVSIAKGSFVVRIQNVGTSALNTFAKVHFKLIHN